MPHSPPLDATVGEALVLRRFALTVLGGATPEGALERAVHACSVPSWGVLLHAEGCARAILDRLTKRGELARLPSDARDALRRSASGEMQRILAAHAQLAEMEVLARGLGAAPVVLKGGAHLAAGGEPLDLCDIDVLVDMEHAEPLWNGLVARGYRVTYADTDDDVDGNHMPAITGPGGIPVEVHRRVVYGTDRYDAAREARPLRGYTALRHAIGPATLRSTLWHATFLHPHRYGRLRDVLLIAALDRALTNEQRRDVDESLAQSDGPELRAMLGQARAVDRGAPIADVDACRRIAARTYAIVLGEHAWIRRVAPIMGVFAFLGFERAQSRAAHVSKYVVGQTSRTSRWYPKRLERLSPQLAMLAAFVGRTAPRAAVTALAVGAAPHAIHHARRRVRMADGLVQRHESTA